MSHISLFILRKTNNPDDCADLVAPKTQIFLFFFFCLKLVPDYCFYNKREQVHMGKWAKLVKRLKSGEFEGFFPLTAVYVNLLETNQPTRPTFPLHLFGCQSQQYPIKKKVKKKKSCLCKLAWSHTGEPGALGKSLNVEPGWIRIHRL